VNRRARQNKRSGQVRTDVSPDLNRDDARMLSSEADSLIWNIAAEHIPRFGRTGQFDNKIYNVEQLFSNGSIGGSSSVGTTGYGKAFTTADIQQFSSYAAVFDQYRFMMIEAWLVPAILSLTNSVGTQTMYSVIDYDDANTPTSAQQLLQYTNVQMSSILCGHYKKFRPHNADALYGAGAFSSYGNVQSQWIDVASSAVAHYGIKVIFDQAPSAAQQVPVQLFTRIWVQFRNVF
jgi:hypothetical protein